MRGGVFLYNRKQIENPNLTYEDAYNEIMAQVKKVDELSNGKLKIDHIDVHHHLEDNEYIKFAVHDIAKELNLPVRRQGYSLGLRRPDICYHDFTIENVNIEEIEKMINQYKNTNSVVELITHSGFIDDYTKTITSYIERDKELQILKQAKESGFFNSIELISFKDI